ncbi:DivIVA domain-containing protein [Streptomyces sp. NPDC093109]|uniref:DivIVA domain-containing protein n=1 Tax=Streptomyces sp. NPDC093109 TaxID=3154977 RepID=UPI00344B4DA2
MYRKRDFARVALVALVIVTSVPAVALVDSRVRWWVWGVVLPAVVFLFWRLWRIAFVEDQEGVANPDEVLRRSDFERFPRDIETIGHAVRDRRFRSGRFANGYKKDEVDRFFDNVSKYLDGEGVGIAVSEIRGKEFTWAVRSSGYDQTEVMDLQRRVARDLGRILGNPTDRR